MIAHAIDDKLARIIADFPILQTRTKRGKRLIYLDSAATSQKPQVVIDTLIEYYSSYNANVHRGVYEIAERATDAYEGARAKIATFINAREPAEVIWTRSTTEAINLVAYTWAAQNVRAGDAILCSQLEHHSNLVPWQVLAQRTGAQLRFIPVDERGLHVLDNIDTLLAGVKIVALSHVSNTLGTIAPLDEIIPRAHAAGAVVLVDGAQSAPNMPVDVRALDVDFFTFSGHKMCGPTGIGALYGKRELLEAMPPFLYGGDMIRKVEYAQSTFNEIPWKFEAGTPNIADAIAFGAAIDYLSGVGMEWVRDHERELMAYAFEQLAGFESRGLQIYGPQDPRLVADVISFNFADIHAHDLASLLDTEGVCIRAGHHCTMPLMEKMGWPATARASFYLYNTRSDVDAMIVALERAAHVFRLA